MLIDISLLVLAVLVINEQSDSRTHRAQAQGQADLATTPSAQTDLHATQPATAGSPEEQSTQDLTPATVQAIPENVSTQPASLPAGWNVQPASPGTLFLAIDEDGRSRLFGYHPQQLPLTRLTAGAWDDITPASSPDGSRLAFASNRDGWWDLYLLNLSTGAVSRLTATPEYDAAPAWSPDGRWLAYESYFGVNGGLEILLRQVPDGDENVPEPVRLTEDPAADASPAWSPNGRQIAFISDRSGEAEVWLADLDRVEDRFRNLSRSPESQESHPAWSPDGLALAWSSSVGGYQSIQGWEFDEPGRSLHGPGSGDWPVWSPDGSLLAAVLAAPNDVYLTGYPANRNSTAGLSLPPMALSGRVNGLCWGTALLPQPLPALFSQAAGLTRQPAWQPRLTAKEGIPEGRFGLVTLTDVSATYPLLQDQADEAFSALRKAVATRAGWDFLASLENAYVPLTTPLFPGMLEEWLYTGRAFAFHSAPLQAGWVVTVREDFGAETYWRVWVRARYQDGSQGVPLHELPWNFAARSSGEPRAYEQGGALVGSVPPGYWLDFTALANGLGWQRLPALNAWRSAYGAARYNEFVLTGDLDWDAAMLEIYPPLALVSPTPLVPPPPPAEPTAQATSTPTQVVEAVQIPKAASTTSPATAFPFAEP